MCPAKEQRCETPTPPAGKYSITILRSSFRGKVGTELQLLHYAIQIDGDGIHEFGRYDGTEGILKRRLQRHAGEEVVTAFRVDAAKHPKEEVVRYIQQQTAGQKWSYFGPNCVTVARDVVDRYGYPENQALVKAGENNFARVVKEVLRHLPDMDEATLWQSSFP
eukprot:GGOE01055262.1.p1 GENE.GGOE01055262.1~~GGOE01055262.1.p1  ORF type:complete len:164 (-),score=30.03 GGOE01055262.1:244-735(-)